MGAKFLPKGVVKKLRKFKMLKKLKNLATTFPEADLGVLASDLLEARKKLRKQRKQDARKKLRKQRKQKKLKNLATALPDVDLGGLAPIYPTPDADLGSG